MSEHVDAALAKNDRSLAIAELLTDMQNSPRYDRFSLEQMRKIAIAEIDRRLADR